MNPIVENIGLLFAGGVAGVICTEVYNNYKKKKSQKKDEKILRELNKEAFKENEGYVALDHAIPFYVDHSIQMYDSERMLIIDIPEKYREKFKRSRIEIHETISFDGISSLTNIFD